MHKRKGKKLNFLATKKLYVHDFHLNFRMVIEYVDALNRQFKICKFVVFYIFAFSMAFQPSKSKNIINTPKN